MAQGLRGKIKSELVGRIQMFDLKTLLPLAGEGVETLHSNGEADEGSWVFATPSPAHCQSYALAMSALSRKAVEGTIAFKSINDATHRLIDYPPLGLHLAFQIWLLQVQVAVCVLKQFEKLRLSI